MSRTDFSNTPMIDLAATVAEHLKLHGIEIIVVGGLAVEIYTDNLYLTKDIDMVNINYTRADLLKKAMVEIGFIKKGRIYINPTTDISIEFPPAPLSVGNSPVKATTIIKSSAGEIPILFAEDVVKDRLAAFFHWKDNPSLVQAITIMIKHSIKPDKLKDYCVSEGEAAQFERVETLYEKALHSDNASMEAIEKIVIAETLSQL